MTQNISNAKVAVVGAGLMGCGIASKFALAGFDVVVYDSDASSLSRAKQNCHAIFMEMAVANLITQPEVVKAEERVRAVASLAELSEATLVIEAIAESVSAKQLLYAGLEVVLPETAIIASTTSNIVPETLSEHLRRPGRFLVAHFWNPPHIIRLVEVVPTLKTEHGTVATTIDLLTLANCKTVLLSKAVPGFIGNRLQFAVLREALHLLQAGIADADTIDEVMKQTLGRRYRWIGPLEGADIGGLETFLAIGSQLMPDLACSDEGLDILRQLVSEKRGGRRDGQGIYSWNAERELRLKQSRWKMLTQVHDDDSNPTVQLDSSLLKQQET